MISNNSIELKSTNIRWKYILVFLFLILCGFPSGELLPAKTYLLSLIGIIYFIHNKHKIPKTIILYIFSYVIIGFIQAKYWGFYSKRTIIELPLLIFSGYFIIQYTGKSFAAIYLKIIYFLALVSIIFFVIMIITGFIPNLLDIQSYKSIFIYNIRLNEIERIRNCGPFWEPGAYGGYLSFTGILFFNNLNELWQKERKKIIVILLAIATTFSTQAYAIVFLLLLFSIFRSYNGIKLVFITFLMLGIFIFAYTSLDFLGEKITEQLELTQNLDNNSLLSANRFTTALTEYLIFLEHPFVGNTNNQLIFYQDIPFILEQIEDNNGYASGSGITTFLAQYGILIFSTWSILSFLNLKKYYGTKSALFCLIILFFAALGEQYTDQLLYVCLPFIILNSKLTVKNKSILK